MTDPALLGRLRLLEIKLDRLTEAIQHVATAIENADKNRWAPTDIIADSPSDDAVRPGESAT